MEITYGIGTRRTPAAVLDLATGEIFSLDGVTSPNNPPAAISNLPNPTAQMFAYLGGELLQSNSKGGVGRLADGAGYVQLSVLNTDAKYPKAPAGALTADGRRFFVTSTKAKVGRGSRVIFVRDSDGLSEVFAVPNRAADVYRALREPDSLRTGPRNERTLRSYAPWDGERMSCKKKRVATYGRFGAMGVLSPSRILDLLFWGDLYHRYAFVPRHPSPWFQGLGLASAIDGELYFNSGGILRAKVNPRKKLSELITSVTFITDPRPGSSEHDLYIVTRQGKPTLTGRYMLRPENDEVAGSRYVVEITAAEAQAMIKSGQLLPKYINTLLAPPTS